MVLSLHQPRSDAFKLFSRLIILSRGDVVYGGLTSRCLPWFAQQGLEPETDVNPLDWLIDVSSVDTREHMREENDRARVGRLIDAWKNGRPQELVASPRVALGEDAADVGTVRASERPGAWRQTIILTSR